MYVKGFNIESLPDVKSLFVFLLVMFFKIRTIKDRKKYVNITKELYFR